MAHPLAFIEADWRNDALLEAFEGLPQLAIASGWDLRRNDPDY